MEDMGTCRVVYGMCIGIDVMTVGSVIMISVFMSFAIFSLAVCIRCCLLKEVVLYMLSMNCKGNFLASSLFLKRVSVVV
jgi:hypothetical protein